MEICFSKLNNVIIHRIYKYFLSAPIEQRKFESSPFWSLSSATFASFVYLFVCLLSSLCLPAVGFLPDPAFTS